MGNDDEPELNEIRPRLWNADIGPLNFTSDGEKQYRDTILEQYKLYVEMADRISSRRGLTNTFFLTLNTLVFSLFGAFWKDRPSTIPAAVLLLVLVVTLSECGAWWTIIRSYRQLNSGKYKVIGLLEERLPASPYWSAEWEALGRGKNIRLYLPLTHVEQWVPAVFAAVYILGCTLAISS